MLRILVEDTAAQQIPEDLLLHPHPHQILQSGGHSPIEGSTKRSSIDILRDQKPIVPPIRTTTPVLEETVKATLSPLLSPGPGRSPRPSGEFGRASFDALRRESTDLNKLSRRSMDLTRLNMDGPARISSTSSRRSLSRSRSRPPQKRTVSDQPKKTSDKQDSSDSFVQSLEDPSSSAIGPSPSEETQGSASQILQGSEVFFSPTIQRSQSASRQRTENSLGTNVLSQSPTRFGDQLQNPFPKHAATTGSIEGSLNGQPEALSTPTLQSIVKAGSYPLQRAAGFATYLNKHSKRMSTLLATESMG